MNRLSAIVLIAVILFVTNIFHLQPQTAENLLSNPGFEETFTERTGEAPQNVAEDWTPWHIARAEGGPAYSNHAPFYDEETVRTRGDEEGKAQVYFNQYATHQGGVYQQVSNLTSGTSYRFSIYAWVWSSTGQDWTISEQPGNVSVRVGIDPDGGTDPSEDAVVWSTTAVFLYNAFYQYSVIAEAEGTTITVFVESTVGEPVANNYIYLDDAVLEVATQTSVEVESSPTSETNEELVQENQDTATPTEQPADTDTDLPTETPIPEPTATMTAESGQIGTRDSEGSGPVELPVASESPSPTETPLPSDTPEPTATATATATPTAAAGGGTQPATDEFPDTVTHVVVEGDTVSGIALRYDSTADAIRRANNLNRASLIVVGQRLIVPINLPDPTETPLPSDVPTLTNTPIPPSETPIPPTATTTPSPTATPITHVIVAGDTLVDIALRYGTTVDVLATLNGIADPDRLDVGLALLIPTAIPPSATPTQQPSPTVQASSGYLVYTVQVGDTLDVIARTYNTTIDAIVQANGITNPSLIFPGLVLRIPTAGSTIEVSADDEPVPTATRTPVPTPTPLPTTIPTTYTVQAGDTLFQIAIRFGVSVVELAAINNIIDYNRISIGQVLTIPG